MPDQHADNSIPEGQAEEARESSPRDQAVENQCILFTNLENYASNYDRAHYRYFRLLDSEISPSLIVSTLTGRNNIAPLFTITPQQMAALVPKFRLFKRVYSDETGPQGADHELSFEDYTDPANIANITSNRAGRGGGVGLKSFSWKFMGVNPFESDKSIVATMDLHFNTLEEVIRPQQDGAVSFLDIMFPVRRGPDAAPSTLEVDPRHAQAMVVVGWSIPSASTALFPQRLRDAVEELSMTLFLTYTKHEFKFNQNGSVDLKVSFQAAVDTLLTHVDTDIFSSSGLLDEVITVRGGELRNQTEIEEEINRLEAHVEQVRGLRSTVDAYGTQPGCYEPGIDPATRHVGVPGAELSTVENRLSDLERGLDAIRARLDNLKRARRQGRYERFISYLLDNSRVFRQDLRGVDVFDLPGDPPGGRYRFYANTENVREVHDDPHYAGVGQRAASRAARGEDAGEFTEETLSGRRRDDRGYFFDFMFFGDLLEAAFGLVLEGNPLNPIDQYQIDKMRMMIGPMVYPDPLTGQLRKVNIAKIPISLDLFMRWFVNEIIAKQREKLTLKSFVKGVMTKVLGGVFKSRCFPNNTDPPKISTLLFTAPAGSDPVAAVTPGFVVGDKILTQGGDLLHGNRAGSSDPADLLHYLIIHQSDHADRTLRGDPGEDFQRGIYHFIIGQDSGLLKDIRFKRTDIAYQTESRLETQGTLGRGYLREKYDARVRLFGNSMFLPGMYVYLNPTFAGLGHPSTPQTVANLIGLGGYYLVESVQATIGRGKFETELEAIWQQSGVTRATSCPPPLDVTLRLEELEAAQGAAVEGAEDNPLPREPQAPYDPTATLPG